MSFTLKNFILSSVIFIILYLIQKLYFIFGKHNWSKYGYRDNDARYVIYLLYKWIFISSWSIYVIILILEWFYKL